MLMACDLSQQLGFIDKSLYFRTEELLKAAGLPIALTGNAHAVNDLGDQEYSRRLQSLSTETFLDLMSMDKKVADGKLNLVLLEGPLGRCVVTDKFDSSLLQKVVSKYCVLDRVS